MSIAHTGFINFILFLLFAFFFLGGGEGCFVGKAFCIYRESKPERFSIPRDLQTFWCVRSRISFLF